MKKIHKKVYQEYFEQIAQDKKSYEFRLADWECSPGDTLILDEITADRQPTGRSIIKRVGFVGYTKDTESAGWFPAEDVEKHGYQIISLLNKNDLWEVSVKAVIFNPDKTKILLPLYDDGYYGAIGGHLDYNESFEDGLRREIKEETGINFTGEFTEVEILKQEWKRPKHGYETHKIVIYYQLTLPEDIELRLEKEEPETVSLDWVSLDDVFSGKAPTIGAYIETVKKALAKEEK
jgi:8-oxo-dGTP pyrophosphatase MutT (NUDIX family)